MPNFMRGSRLLSILFQRQTSNIRRRSRLPITVDVLEDRTLLATFVVNSLEDNLNEDDFLTLREAVQLVNEDGNDQNALWRSLTTGEAAQIDTTEPFGTDDTIVFDAGLAGGSIDMMSGELTLLRNVRVVGLGADQLTIDAQGSSRIFSIIEGVFVALENLELTNGLIFGGVGGAIWNQGMLTLDSVSVTNNEAGAGGGIYNENGSLTIVGASEFSQNEADSGGAISNTNGVVMINGPVILSGNESFSFGGAIDNQNGELTLRGATLSANSTIQSGGGISSFGGSISIIDTVFEGNGAFGLSFFNPTTGRGGGIYFAQSFGPPTELIVENSAFNSNAAGIGGAIYVDSGTASIRNANFSSNSASGSFSGNSGPSGGAIFNDGTVEIVNSTMLENRSEASNNFPSYGGAILNEGVLTLDSVAVSSNESNHGGGVYNDSGSLTIIGTSSFSENEAVLGLTDTSSFPGDGGAIGNTNGDVTITGPVTFSENTAGGSGGVIFNEDGDLTLDGPNLANNSGRYGGAVFNSLGTVRIVNASLDSNVARTAGGGVYNESGSVTVSNSMLTLNTAEDFSFLQNSGLGGAIFNAGVVDILTSTLSVNSAFGDGGALYNANVASVTNSTISGNTSTREGGGILNEETLSIASSTIVFNRGDLNSERDTSGGIHNRMGSDAFLFNSIVAGNAEGDTEDPADIFGDVDTSSANNLIGDPNSAGGLADGNNSNIVGDGMDGIIDINTVLDSNLRDNGGGILTHAILPGSSALDAGDDTLAATPGLDSIHATGDDGEGILGTDQRGDDKNRIENGKVDIGAFEFQSYRLAISAETPTLEEDDDGPNNFVFTVIRTSNTTGTATVRYTVVPGDTDENDFVNGIFPTGMVTFANGETSRTIHITVRGDETVELDEDFSVLLDMPSERTIITNANEGSTIVNDDSAVITIGNATQNEDAGSATFTVSLSKLADIDVQVDVLPQEDTANSSDFTIQSTTAVIQAGSASTTISIDLTADEFVELDEHFFVNLVSLSLEAGGRNVEVGPTSGVGTITNDDEAAISVSDAIVDEDSGSISFEVTIDRSIDVPLSVDFGTAFDSADATDFAAANGTLTFATGERSKMITVNLSSDSDVEPDEVFFLNLSNLQAAGRSVTILDSQARGTIRNDDTEQPPVEVALSISDVSGPENSGPLLFTVTLTQAVDVDVVVAFSTATDTASANDYTATSGTLTIPAGETSGTITVVLTPDSIVEPDEHFVVRLTNPQAGSGVNVTIADDRGIGTIENDDSNPPTGVILSIGNASGLEDDGVINFPVTLSQPISASVRFRVQTVFGTADSSDLPVADFSFVVPPQTTSTTFSIQITTDTISEIDEQFAVILSDLQADDPNVTFGNNQATGTIQNDDIEVIEASISIRDAVNDEDAGVMSFRVELSQPIDHDITVDYATSFETATVGDFTATNGTITILAGQTAADINVFVTPDSVRELDEQFFVSLSNPQVSSGNINLSILDGRATGTIRNDDDELPANATLAINDVSGTEDSGSLVFTVTLSESVEVDVLVDFSTATDSASAGDLTETSGTITVPAGQTSRTITIDLSPDRVVEPDEQFFVLLSNPQVSGSGVEVSISDDRGIGTILNDDSVPAPQVIDQPIDGLVINGSFRHVVSGNFDSNPATAGTTDDLFFWDPVSGFNRIVYGNGSLVSNPFNPTLLNGNDFTEVLVGDFDGVGGDDLFFWNPRSGRNRIAHAAGAIQTNVISPPAVNGNDFTMVVAANLDHNGPEDLFFWNPRTGRNRLVHFTAPVPGSVTGVGSIQTNVVPATALNGNSYQTVHVGEFIAGGSQLPELMFISLATGANRIVELSSGPGLQTNFANLRTNVLPPSAFNGSDFSQFAIGDVNLDGLDDVFAWDPSRGRNRIALTNPLPGGVPIIRTNTVNPGAINGEYDHVVRLTDQVFSNSLADNFFFWDEITGRNRRAFT